MTKQGGRLPVTVVTGFLGAGKTTLLRHLLLNSGQRLAVLVNEFGEVGIDGDLLRSCGFCPEEELDTRLVELANGCLCCTVQDDFLPTMEKLLERADSLDGIVVETSGLALPEPLIAALNWPQIRTRIRLNGVVAVVDGEALASGSVVANQAALEAQRLADPSLDHASAIDELFAEQLEAADLVLISRADCLSADEIDLVHKGLAPQLQPGAVLLPMGRGVISPELVLGLERRQPTTTGHDHHDHEHDHDHEDHDHEDHDHEHHDHSHVAIESLALELAGDFCRVALEQQLLQLVADSALIRLKGRLWLSGKNRPLQIQAVGPRLECWFEPGTGQASGTQQAPGLELVLLGFQLDHPAIESCLNQALTGELAAAN